MTLMMAKWREFSTNNPLKVFPALNKITSLTLMNGTCDSHVKPSHVLDIREGSFSLYALSSCRVVPLPMQPWQLPMWLQLLRTWLWQGQMKGQKPTLLPHPHLLLPLLLLQHLLQPRQPQHLRCVRPRPKRAKVKYDKCGVW